MADKKGFDLANLLKDVPKLDTADGRDQIEYIDISQIESDPGNFYNLVQLEELASNIAVVGLQQPLRVRTSETDPEKVVVVSGHRRQAALKLLIKEGREDLRAVPCIRERVAGSAALQELRLIFANRDTRVISSGEIAKQAERVEMLLYQLKEEGFEFPGRMRDHVAQACKISAPKLSRLKVIRENLIPQYMNLFEKDDLPEQTAYALARLPGDFQLRMFNTLLTTPSGATVEKVLGKYNEGWRWDPKLTCPDGKACKRGDVFLRRDCETSWQGFCGGNTCCLECDQAKSSYSPCERMCSKAKAQRKETADKKKEEEHKRQQKNGRKFQKETQGYARRLLRAIDAAGVPDDAKIDWSYYDGIPVSTIRQWAAGEFDDPAGWHGPRLVPGRCRSDHMVELSKLLNCSTDFLMGLTDEIRPAPVQEELEEAPEDPMEALEAETASADSWDDISEVLDQAVAPEEPARRIRWEDRGRTPPVDKLILTYQLTNDGPAYRPALWDGSKFRSPDGRKELTGLQYTHWLEVPTPGSGETLQAAPPELAEGQLAICGWMPGGTFPGEPGEAVVDFDLGDGVIVREVCCYADGQFYFRAKSGELGAKIDMPAVRWMWLPPVE
ncbi:ParB/RepB/Spo0J family partition protein [Oscillospiraceae bacterium 50-58]